MNHKSKLTNSHSRGSDRASKRTWGFRSPDVTPPSSIDLFFIFLQVPFLLSKTFRHLVEVRTAQKNKTNQGSRSQEKLRQEGKMFCAAVGYGVLGHVCSSCPCHRLGFTDLGLLVLPIAEKSM